MARDCRLRPDVIAFSCSDLANVPAITDLAKATKARRRVFIWVGGQNASFTAAALPRAPSTRRPSVSSAKAELAERAGIFAKTRNI